MVIEPRGSSEGGGSGVRITMGADVPVLTRRPQSPGNHGGRGLDGGVRGMLDGMSELRAYLQAFDDAWAHAWESLESALDGVSEDVARYQHPAYAQEAREEGWPAPGSIAWQVAHVTHCKRHYTELIRGVGQPGEPEVEAWTAISSFSGLLDALKAAHEAQRAAIQDLDEEHLDLRVREGVALREFLAMCIRHDTWHAAQIAVARRLARVGG